MLIMKLMRRFQNELDGEGNDLGGGEAVGSGNDARVAMLERINDANDGLRADELAAINDDGTTEDFVPNSLIPSDDGGVTETEMARMEAEVTPEPEAPAGPRMITRKVNGRDLTLSEDEWFARASKVEAADQYLNEAARMRREAEQLLQPPAPSPVDAQANSVESRRALVRAIQMGTEEEAMAALEQLQTPRAPQLSPDDLTRAVDERLTFKEAIGKFESEFKDVLSDPQLRQMAFQRDQELLAAGDRRSYYERYAGIGSEIRAWRDNLVKSYAPPSVAADPLATKAIAKADAAKRSVPRPANAKAQAVAAAEDAEPSPSEVIAAIAKARGGPQWSRA